jgi:GntR family transcriptional regulator
VATATDIQPIDPAADRPAYKQIADQLRVEIADGVFKPGQKLPSVTQLMHEFAASRATVGRALTLLRNEGRVRAERGVGVFVREARPLVFLKPSDRFDRKHREAGLAPLQVDAEAQGLSVKQEILKLEEVPAPADIAEHLGLNEGEMVFVRRRLVRLGRKASPDDQCRPAQLADSYLPMDIATGKIREMDSGSGGTYARIEEQGNLLTHFTEDLSFRMPSPYEARLLQLDAGVPVIDLTRVAYAGSRAVECFTSVIAGDKYSIEYRIKAH